MSIWESLGIDPTNDIAVIKKAYAAKAKNVHPEEHPEEFKALQNAYKTAVKIAKFVKPSEMISFPDLEMPKDAAPELKPPNTAPVAQKPPPENTDEVSPQFDYGRVQELSEDVTSRFWEELQFIRWNPCLRNQLACWKLFLHRPEYEKLLMQDDIREEFVCQILRDRPLNWTLPVIEYLTRTLKSFQSEKKKHYETDSGKWLRFRKRTPAQKGRTSKNLIPSPFFSKKERKLFCSIEGTEALAWDAKVNMEQYLNDYFAFARENSYDLEKMYKKHTRWTKWGPAVISVLVIIVFYAWIVLPGLLMSGSQDSRPFYEQTLEQLQQEYEQNGQSAQEREHMLEEMSALLESYESMKNNDQGDHP